MVTLPMHLRRYGNHTDLSEFYVDVVAQQVFMVTEVSVLVV